MINRNGLKKLCKLDYFKKKPKHMALIIKEDGKTYIFTESNVS